MWFPGSKSNSLWSFLLPCVVVEWRRGSGVCSWSEVGGVWERTSGEQVGEGGASCGTLIGGLSVYIFSTQQAFIECWLYTILCAEYCCRYRRECQKWSTSGPPPKCCLPFKGAMQQSLVPCFFRHWTGTWGKSHFLVWDPPSFTQGPRHRCLVAPPLFVANSKKHLHPTDNMLV